VVLRYILPVIASVGAAIERRAAKTLRITKPNGTLGVRTDAPDGFGHVGPQRVFNLVPGMQCVPLLVSLAAGQQTTLELYQV